MIEDVVVDDVMNINFKKIKIKKIGAIGHNLRKRGFLDNRMDSEEYVVDWSVLDLVSAALRAFLPLTPLSSTSAAGYSFTLYRRDRSRLHLGGSTHA